jgi:hypothetical protein
VKRAQWVPGSVVAARLRDGRFYAARLLDFPWVAFYEGSDEAAPDDAAAMAARPVFRLLAVHRDLLAEGWGPIAGTVPTAVPERPPRTFVQSPINPSEIKILETSGSLRPASYEEAQGLPSASVWEPQHVEDMLVAHAEGQVDEWTESLALVDPSRPRDPRRTDPTQPTDPML